jgi:hypothetical protein
MRTVIALALVAWGSTARAESSLQLPDGYVEQQGARPTKT